jgi:hypothetical protein
MNLGGLTNGVKFTSGGGVSNTFTLPSATGYTFTFPNATGTLALTSDISYPVTSVFGRTGAVVATSGDYTTAQVTESGNLYFTDSRARLALSFVAGSGAYNSTTGVITIPTNNNQITNGSNYITLGSLSAGTGISYNNTTGVITNSAPDQTVALTASTGISVTGTYPNFTITNTSPSSGGTVTSVAALTIGTSGTDLSSTVANSTTTPVITLNVPTASAANRGALSSADWSTFNGKYNLPSLTSGSVLFSNGTTIAQDNANFFWDDTNNRLGIGTASPAALLHVSQSGANTQLRIGNNSAFDQFIYFNGNNDWSIGMDYSNSNAFVISNNSSLGTNDRVVLTTSGNLGLGVTPSAWGSILKVNQIGNYGAFIAGRTDSINQIFIGVNAYYNGTSWLYSNTSSASRYYQDNGFHIWDIASSGTAGNAITWTQAMTLFSTGNLAVGTTTDSGYKLDVNGTGRFTGDVNITSTTGNSAFIKLNRLSTTNSSDILFSTNGTDDWFMGTNALGTNLTDFYIYRYGVGTAMSLAASTGAATFSSSVTAGGNIQTDGTANKYIKSTGFISNQTGQLADFGAADSGFFIASTGIMNFVAAGSTRFTIGATGAITCTSSVTATSFFESSSIKGKDIIATNPLLALDIDVIKYTRKSDESKDIRYGYSAEQIHSLMPELTDKDITAVKYLDVHTILISQLQQEIKELKAKMN